MGAKAAVPVAREEKWEVNLEEGQVAVEAATVAEEVVARPPPCPSPVAPPMQTSADCKDSRHTGRSVLPGALNANVGSRSQGPLGPPGKGYQKSPLAQSPQPPNLAHALACLVEHVQAPNGPPVIHRVIG